MAPIRKVPFALLAILVSPLVVGCMPATPRTVFEWDVNDSMPRTAYRPSGPARVAATASRSSRGVRTYVYTEALAPIPTPRPRVVRQAQAAPVPTPRPATPVSYAPAAPSVSFAWPVTGPVIADFGTTLGGGKNDGINIATAMDAPIRAAASGSVTYAGDELKGYGNLVLIKHADGYTTAYAHADRLLVQRGDFVAKGQVIGYAGQTGDVSRPQLHFEIRANTTPVNPRAYLTTQQTPS
jgi:murein DD-endopeptidase MepM/ murein hydrolase activator NlpD